MTSIVTLIAHEPFRVSKGKLLVWVVCMVTEVEVVPTVHACLSIPFFESCVLAFFAVMASWILERKFIVVVGQTRRSWGQPRSSRKWRNGVLGSI